MADVEYKDNKRHCGKGESGALTKDRETRIIGFSIEYSNPIQSNPNNSTTVQVQLFPSLYISLC